VVAVVKKIRGGRERRELLLLHNLVEKKSEHMEAATDLNRER